MVYTEVQNKNGKKYYYRVISVRKGKKISKKRVYLGVDLNKVERLKKEKKADKELLWLESLLSDSQSEELKKIKEDYLSQPKENLENRYESFCSLFTYNSTAIEGNTLTLQETSQLLFENQVPSKSLREINETINHKEAFDFILKAQEDISKKFILSLHKTVVKNTLKKELENQIGKYRTLQVYIRGAETIPPNPEQVPKEMKSLLSWYSKNKKKLPPLILAAYFHSVLEAIHPFADGNGRVGRVIFDFILHKNNFPMINIPNSKKITYYNSLEEAQIKANLKPFIIFLMELLKKEKIKF